MGAALYVILVAVAVLVTPSDPGEWLTLKELAEVVSEWPVWLTLFILQFAMLTVPARILGLQPLTRWSKWPSLVAGGVMMGGLVAGTWLALCEWFRCEFLSWSLLLAIGLVTWLLWFGLFMLLSRRVMPTGLLARQCQALFRSSLVTLLITVPGDVVATHRIGLFAGTCTGLGMLMGMVALLFPLLPMAFLRRAARWGRIGPADPTDETDSTLELALGRRTPLVALGVLAGVMLVLGLSRVIWPPPTDAERMGQFTLALNESFRKESGKQGWVSDGKGGWTTATNTPNYKKLNEEMEKAGWTVVSKRHYVLTTNSHYWQQLKAGTNSD
jgi:hypothetical protein